MILYRGLTGRQPFRGASIAEYFDEILNREPRPPRQFSNEIPRELERFCLRCLSRQMSDRYLTAADQADDLRLWLFEESREPSTATAAPPVVPKGLHSFGSEDAGFFLRLLPGPRGSDGLPESVRFRKSRIEVEEGDVAFSIGVIYGPSGGGKSSFVKAGLTPLLDRARVRPIAVEATPNGTEELLLSELRRVVPLRPINSESELDRAVEVIDSLIAKEGLDSGQEDYLDVLGDLVHKYEAEHDPMAAVSGADMVRFLVESNEMAQTELVQRSGIAESTISEILAGKRKLSRCHIAVLSRDFRVSPAVFFPEAVELTPERVARIISRRSGLELARDLLVSLASAFACDSDRACWRAFQELVAGDSPGMPTDLMASRAALRINFPGACKSEMVVECITPRIPR